MSGTVLDRAGVKNKFDVYPEQIIDYLALVGDSSDNIPGIEKVGPKTAAKWLNQYGSLDALIEHVMPGAHGTVPPKGETRKADAHPMHGHEPTKGGTKNAGQDEHLMPGMLTKAQMDALKKAKGAEFDRLFLTGMIQHHNGALVMVDELFKTAGSGQDAELFNFATDVDSGQRAEIRSMQTLLDKKP